MKKKSNLIIKIFILSWFLFIIGSCKKTSDISTEITTPTVETYDAISITYSSAILNGSITNNGNDYIKERGICWSQNPNPTIDNNKELDQISLDNDIEVKLENLKEKTKYYFRAYAINKSKIGYGEEKTFTTDAEPLTPWKTKASLNIACQDMGVVAFNNKIYVFGGYNGNYLSQIEEYDPLTNKWTSKPEMLIPGNPSAIVANGKIYLIGGSGSTLVQEYDPINNAWKTHSPMPTNRRPYVALVENKIYAIGGYNSTEGSLATNEEFDFINNSWELKKHMPTARNSTPIASFNNKIYAFGGEYIPPPYNLIEEYDPITDLWQEKSSKMFVGRTGMAAVTLDNKIYVIGGHSSSGELSLVEVYDPSNDTWKIKTSMPTKRTHIGAAVLNGKIYVIGGAIGGGFSNSVEVYDPSLDL